MLPTCYHVLFLLQISSLLHQEIPFDPKDPKVVKGDDLEPDWITLMTYVTYRRGAFPYL